MIQLNKNKKTLKKLPIYLEKTMHVPNICDVPGTNSLDKIYLYKSRIIPIMAEDNYLLLPETQINPALELSNYYAFYFNEEKDSKFIAVPESKNKKLSDLIVDNSEILDFLKNRRNYNLEAFFISESLEKIANITGNKIYMSSFICSLLNNKFFIRNVLNTNGINVPMGKLIKKEYGDFLTQALNAVNYLKINGAKSFCITRPFSCSGQGIFQFNNEVELEYLLNTKCKNDQELIINMWLDNVVATPSAQIKIEDDLSKSFLFAITDQIVEENVHKGNVIPSQYTNFSHLRKQIDKIIKIIWSIGGRGVMGIDFIVTLENTESNPCFYVTEINARQTGATYSSVLSYELVLSGKHCVSHNNLVISKQYTLNQYVDILEKNGIHFNFNKNEGIIITSNGNLVDNKIMLLSVADTKEKALDLIEEAKI